MQALAVLACACSCHTDSCVFCIGNTCKYLVAVSFSDTQINIYVFQFSHFNIFSFSTLNHDPQSELEAHLHPYGSELPDQLINITDLGVGRELKQTANIGLKFKRWTQTSCWFVSAWLLHKYAKVFQAYQLKTCWLIIPVQRFGALLSDKHIDRLWVSSYLASSCHCLMLPIRLVDCKANICCQSANDLKWHSFHLCESTVWFNLLFLHLIRSTSKVFFENVLSSFKQFVH